MSYRFWRAKCPRPGPFVSTNIAAWLADMNDRILHRAIDECVLPARLVERGNGRRAVALLVAPLMRFYEVSADQFTARWRRMVLQEVSARVLARPDAQALLALEPAAVERFEGWVVDEALVQVDLRPVVGPVLERLARLQKMYSLVDVQPGKRTGTPLLAGTQIPVELVAGCARAGEPFEAMARAYPGLTPALVDAACLFTMLHPPRGRPRRVADLVPGAHLAQLDLESSAP